MKRPRGHLPRDLKALRYLDALNAGDLEAVAALWEEASRDPDLERVLAELDGALLVESLTANGCACAEPVSEFLPTPLSATRRLWGTWVGVGGVLAAACLLCVLAWSRHPGKAPELNPATVDSRQQVPPRAPDKFVSIPDWSAVRRVVDGAEESRFHWPLPERSPIRPLTSIPPDLLE
jgi:hypothetical protein